MLSNHLFPPIKLASNMLQAIYIEWLPSVLFGATALIAGGLMLTTPETLNTRLPDTIQDAERLAKKPQQQANDDIQMNARS